MNLKSTMISLVVLGIFLTGSLTFLGSIANNYNQAIDTSGFSQTALIAGQVQNDSQDIWNRTLSVKFTGANGFTIFYDLMVAAWQTLAIITKSIFSIPVVIYELLGSLSVNGVAIPGWFVGGLIVIMMINLGFILIEAYFRWKLEN